ncbi:major capsid protein [Capybara microvirus Cap1_SP_82]|nr:major capsid protein [Capybara microvirus Cap1_SP_82]
MSIFDIHKLKNSPTWSEFDISQNKKFSSKIGQILPVAYRTVLPGDKVNLPISHFTQTLPLNKNSFARIREHVDVFFVPFRLLYSKANDILVNNTDSQVALANSATNNIIPTELPFTTISILNSAYKFYKAEEASPSYTFKGHDIAGFSRAENMKYLCELLGYGDITRGYADSEGSVDNKAHIPLSMMPICAYQKIYADFFRYQQWEDNNPYTYNFDYKIASNGMQVSLQEITLPGFGANIYGNGIFDLRYKNYNKDYYFGLLPSQVNDIYLPKFDMTLDTEKATEEGHFQRFNDITTTLSVLQLRASYALQKWSEIQLFSDKNYKDKIKHHFNVDVPDYTANQAQYLGGYSSVMQINDIVNTNLAQANAERKAIGNSANSGHINFDCKEHGIIMAVYYALPLMDYGTLYGYDPEVTHVTADDFPKPEFDNLGLSPVYLHNLIDVPDNLDKPIGYAPRYWDFKSCVDKYCGAFNLEQFRGFTIEHPWNLLYDIALSEHPEDLPDIYWMALFKCTPNDAKFIFSALPDSTRLTDTFLTSLDFDFKVNRCLSYNGMPY